MKALTRTLLGLALVLRVLAAGPALAQEPDAEGSKDHPLFNRMAGYRIQRYEEKEFESHIFRDATLAELPVEGHYYHIVYSLQDGAKEASRAQILRNYENAVKAIGGTVLKSDWDGTSFLKVARDGKEIWVEVSAYITSEWSLSIIEKQAMAQEIVANAEAFRNDLRATGHAAVYGIYFDTGKAALKPASEAAIAEIAKLLKADAALKLHVVGHTDNVGALDANIKLSQARAEAVVQALTGKHGIAAARLKSAGVASLAPVSSNDTEEGRAKNRRVELVKQ